MCVRVRKMLLVAFGAETSCTSRRVLVGKKRKLKLGQELLQNTEGRMTEAGMPTRDRSSFTHHGSRLG